MQQFARTLTRDIEAMRSAIAGPWSNGEGQSAPCTGVQASNPRELGYCHSSQNEHHRQSESEPVNLRENWNSI
jgi:hypothetical protein